MRVIFRMGSGLLLAAALAVVAWPEKSGVARHDGKGYQALGKLAVLHHGRVKPLDSVARLEIKQIFGRETITLRDADGKAVAAWGPVAAAFDMAVRPDFWDDQEFILVDYTPLKEMLLGDTARARLKALAEKQGVPDAANAEAERLLKQDKISAAEVTKLAGVKGLAADDRKALEALAARLGEARKWLAPREVEGVKVAVDGRRVPFETWVMDIRRRAARSEAPMLAVSKGAQPAISDIEKRAMEVGNRIDRYRVLRGDRTVQFAEWRDMDMAVPRPHGEAYLKFMAAAVDKLTGHGSSTAAGPLTPLEENATEGLRAYLADLMPEQHKLPGRDAEFDRNLAAYLEANADWIPLRIIAESKPEELAAAGFPPKQVAALREAYQAARSAEEQAPGDLDQGRAAAVVASARSLGEALGANPVRQPDDETHQVALALGLASPTHYPTERKVGIETHYNRFAPFYQAPTAHGLGLVCLVLALGLGTAGTGAVAASRRVLYVLGMMAFGAGILLEAYGFALRVIITGYAPVTGMPETVIWVAMICSILGFVMELRTRKIFAAVAGTGIALLATVLAANVALLDPEIKSLPPVLRNNFWLTIHVLTIVSSYAAFALTMGLGLLATGYYLSAIYRRRADWGTLGVWLAPGLPLLAVGGAGLLAQSRGMVGPWAYYPLIVLTLLGIIPTMASLFALAGEAANRAPARLESLGLVLLNAGSIDLILRSIGLAPGLLGYWAVPSALIVVGGALVLLAMQGAECRATFLEAGASAEVLDESALAGDAAYSGRRSHAAEAGGVATLSRPTVAEIRARQAAGPPKDDDPTGQTIRATAARIKPLSNFIYRAMQVGVLLVAAGTILGGVWADYSWGRFWGWDNKEVWALITLLIYLVPLHGRFAGWVNTFGLVCLSVVCFLSVLMAWYGVNFVLGVGLHSYGFTEGGGQGIVAAVSAMVLGFVLAAVWRRRVSTPVGA
ncbi:MAG TPA: cytochrome c biogenesis protein CcsA [Isosphaeraceae bacterium]|jgi:ABC-type transport system involved in cytochrome c biogenesis permease subunit|nr:cytochrome c biogenesis protein CcsA [Isosphaeraceae bacterium]